MNISGISEASNDFGNRTEELKVVFEEEGKKNESGSEMSLRAVSSSSSYRSSSISERSTSPIEPLSPLPISDVRSLTNDYQKLLMQATREIKKLNLCVLKLEKEKQKLVKVNVDLALETESLRLDKEAWKKEELAIIKANDEFATEVGRLYKVEEEQVGQIESLQNQIKGLQDKFSELKQEHLEEQNNLKTEIVDLTESLNSANGKSTRILEKVKSAEEHYYGSIEYLQSTHANERIKFEAKINSLEDSLNKEKELREECEVKLCKLSEDLEKSRLEQETLSSKHHENLQDILQKLAKLNVENEKLKFDNIELAAENTEWKNIQDKQLEKELNWKKENRQLHFENQLLLNNHRFMSDKNEKIKKAFGDEVERVKQLNILNKMVTAENEWFKTSLNDCEKEFEHTKKELEMTKNQSPFKFWNRKNGL